MWVALTKAAIDLSLLIFACRECARNVTKKPLINAMNCPRIEQPEQGKNPVLDPWWMDFLPSGESFHSQPFHFSMKCTLPLPLYILYSQYAQCLSESIRFPSSGLSEYDYSVFPFSPSTSKQ